MSEKILNYVPKLLIIMVACIIITLIIKNLFF